LIPAALGSVFDLEIKFGASDEAAMARQDSRQIVAAAASWIDVIAMLAMSLDND